MITPIITVIFITEKEIQTEEGKAVPNGTVFTYKYDLKDHIGNVRVSFDKNAPLVKLRLFRRMNIIRLGCVMAYCGIMTTFIFTMKRNYKVT